MQRDDFFNLIIGIVSLALAILAIVKPQYRFSFALSAGLVLLGIIMWQSYGEIDKLITENRRLQERLDIHQQLIDIKAELAYLRRRR